MSRTKGTINLSRIVKELIFNKALEDEKFPRRALAVELKDLIGKMGELSPSEEYLEKMISLARNQQPEREDSFWSVFDLEKYSTPPEALPTILKVWRETMKDNKPLTIREALWLGRLYHVFKDVGILDDIPVIISVVRNYASHEKVYKLACRVSKRPIKPEGDIKWLRWIGSCLLYLSTGGMEKELSRMAQEKAKRKEKNNERLNPTTK